MTRPKYPSDKKAQFMLRLPEGMRDRIAAEAEKNGRSMNSEIVAQLERVHSGLTEAETGAREKAFEDALRMFRDKCDIHVPMRWTLVPER